MGKGAIATFILDILTLEEFFVCLQMCHQKKKMELLVSFFFPTTWFSTNKNNGDIVKFRIVMIRPTRKGETLTIFS